MSAAAEHPPMIYRRLGRTGLKASFMRERVAIERVERERERESGGEREREEKVQASAYDGATTNQAETISTPSHHLRPLAAAADEISPLWPRPASPYPPPHSAQPDKKNTKKK